MYYSMAIKGTVLLKEDLLMARVWGMFPQKELFGTKCNVWTNLKEKIMPLYENRF